MVLGIFHKKSFIQKSLFFGSLLVALVCLVLPLSSQKAYAALEDYAYKVESITKDASGGLTIVYSSASAQKTLGLTHVTDYLNPVAGKTNEWSNADHASAQVSWYAKDSGDSLYNIAIGASQGVFSVAVNGTHTSDGGGGVANYAKMASTVSTATTSPGGTTTTTADPATEACKGYTLDTENKACKDGYANSATANYCATTFKGVGQGSLKGACDAGVAAATAGGKGAAGSSEPRCTGGMLGWFLCPMTELFKNLVQWAADAMETVLKTPPLANSNIQSVWATFVGIANLLLVLAFLVVIFSQATSIGLSAYGIKKMLPRIIAAAILINLSYFICSIAVDIANIIGSSVQAIVEAATKTVQPASGTQTAASGTGIGTIIGTVLAAGGLTFIGIELGLLGFLVPVMLAGALAFVSIFVIVAMRQVLIVLLVAVAPLAFAAMILPNTEPLFKKWGKFLINLLIMYPVIMFILYGSTLVGNIVLSQDPNNPVYAIMAFLIMTVAPFAGTYLYLKNANKLMSMAGGGLGKFGAMAQKRSQGWAKSKYDRSTFGVGRSTQRAFKDEAAKERAYGRMADGKSLSGRLGMLGVRGQTRARMNAYTQAQGDKLYKSDVENEQVRLGKTVENNAAASVEAFKDKVESGSITRAQANAHVNHLLSLKGGKTSLRRLFEDQQFMQDLGKAGGTEGMVVGAIGSDKFMAAQPDIANALNYHREQFVKDAQAGKAGEYLGANYAAGATTSSGRTVIDKSKGAFQDWGWYAQRPGMLHAMSHDHTGHVYDKISYNVATATQKDPAFSNADPGIQDMINAIVAAGPPPKGSTATNNLGTFKPGVTGNPTWLNWSK